MEFSRILEVGSHSLLQGILPTQVLKPPCRLILYCLSHHGSRINYMDIVNKPLFLCDHEMFPAKLPSCERGPESPVAMVSRSLCRVPLPGSSVRGILLARVLEPVDIPFSRESSQPRNRTQAGLLHCRQILYHLSHQRSPQIASSLVF